MAVSVSTLILPMFFSVSAAWGSFYASTPSCCLRALSPCPNPQYIGNQEYIFDPELRGKILTLRSLVLRLAGLYVIVVRAFRRARSLAPDECWETTVGQEIYKLLILLTVAMCFSTLSCVGAGEGGRNDAGSDVAVCLTCSPLSLSLPPPSATTRVDIGRRLVERWRIKDRRKFWGKFQWFCGECCGKHGIWASFRTSDSFMLVALFAQGGLSSNSPAAHWTGCTLRFCR